MISYSQIVVGTDGSDSSLKAVKTAASLARVYAAELTIVCAYFGDSDPITAKAHSEFHATPIFTEETATEILAEAAQAAQSEGFDAPKTITKSGSAAAVLLHVAEEISADLLVVGNRGLDSLLGRLLGNIPGEVSRRADIDVMLVNTAEA
ncbi:universal stress protein UspA-like protein [Corynebacterium mustelae]|uniref:Universal stress protein UspA-like protein n=1 Tax=Corynebacterium mustelae TaxID=571915 RepID=A0A0G3H3Z3_9CORY|nr:universal stress protein [Corynebacterium mustelae]AKK05827.1 universal stress protein UspA-like protein [Corynebacterium mustelae]